MIIIVREIRKSMKHLKRKERFFLKFQSIAIFIIIGMLMVAILDTSRGIEALNGSIKDIYDVTMDISEDTHVVKDSLVDKLKQFYNWEVNNFKYIVTTKQPLDNLDPKLSKYKGVKSDNTIHVNDNFFNHYSLGVSEGRLFSEEDYVFKSYTIPVILGNKYKKYIKLHGQFKAEYLGEKINLEVIGFLKEGSYFQDYANLELLDSYIIMPSIEKFSGDIPAKTKSTFFDVYNKCEQHIASSRGISLDSLRSSFENESRFLNLVTPYTVIDKYGSLRMWSLEGEKVISLFKMLAIIIGVCKKICVNKVSPW